MLSNMTILQLQLSALFTKFQGKKVIDPAHLLLAFETLQVIKKNKTKQQKKKKETNQKLEANKK